jgi:hypothetical protein
VPARPLAGAVLVAAALVAVMTGCRSGGAQAGGTATYPPRNLTAFKAFAATGDADALHTMGTSSAGRHFCPSTTIYATVSPALHGRTLEADLSAFFLHSGLINGDCPASVLAYYSRGEYQADHDGGYTAGSVALTASATQRNLSVDTGTVTSGSYDVTSQFSFGF